MMHDDEISLRAENKKVPQPQNQNIYGHLEYQQFMRRNEIPEPEKSNKDEESHKHKKKHKKHHHHHEMMKIKKLRSRLPEVAIMQKKLKF